MFQVIIEYVALAAALFYFHLNYLIMIVSFAALKKSGAAKKYPRVSCIIATKHEENVLEETLRALRKSDYPSKIEIIVVDGSADNKTRAIAKKYADKIIADRRGTGKAYALNLGLKAARGEVIYILDADCVVERSTLKRLVSGLKEGYVACQGFIIPNKGGFAARAFRLEVSYLNMLQAWLHNMTKSSTLQGRNYVIYRKTLAEMGGYSPGVLTEEIDLSLRLYKHGKKMNLAHDARIHEASPRRMRDFLLQQERWLGGTYGTVSSFLPKIGLKEIIIFAPWLFILISPATALLLIIAYLLTGNIIYLIGVALGVAVIYAGALPYLEKKEIAMLPATLVFLTIVEGALSLKVVYNRMMKKEIVWHRMPK